MEEMIQRVTSKREEEARDIEAGMEEQNKRASMAEAQVATLKQVGPGRYHSPRHRMPYNSTSEGSNCGLMTWRAMGLADTFRHVIGCHITQQLRLQNACR